ncbi:POU domain, class 6, transcription factor 1 [Bufo gargarizans]|uniref:POU domain, class 6, transcription factor 1 n=1 Tax=Bufo gargarizans TaxID=30331 RepID=UPI001CF1CADC|nr:POU domain, class 6, transcription factor 1 [Bufo gargarizans]
MQEGRGTPLDTMDTGTVKKHNSPLTVNEQVIVMSGHETIRVLEVGVDTPTNPEESGKSVDPPVTEAPVTNNSTRDTVLCQVENSSVESVVKSSAGLVSPSLPSFFTHASNHPQATLASFALQTAPQVLTQENLTTLFTGVMAPTGAVSQPVLIPITIPGQVAGQQGLAVWNFPTATLATIPGLAATPPAGGMFKLPLANLQAASVLNTALQTPVQAAPAIQTLYQAQPAVQTQAALQAAVQPQAALQVPTALQAQTAMVSSNVAKAEPQTHLTVQPASFTFNPAIISAASIGGQTQLLNSLAAAPIIANAIPGVQGITSQIITNAQGQVIGALPWLLNSPGITAGAAAAAISAPNFVQAVTPQLLLNAQGQIIATLASSAVQQAAVRKQASQDVPAKTEQQPVQQIQPAPTITQPSVVVTNPSPANTSTSTQVHVSCPEPPTVGQLVSKTHSGTYDEDGINLEEIREFAKDFKIRRLSLGLTQTQVGQALTATEGPAYSQSAICRFEKLDITPKSAQKLKPVLEKWLNEAEMRNQEGQQNLMEFVGGEPSKKRKRRTSFTPQAVEALNTYFEKNALPTGQEITDIAKELNYDREVVRVWFCNRRQTLKNTSKLNIFQIP